MWPLLASSLASYALREVDSQTLQDLFEKAVGLRLRAVPHTRAYVVSAINEVLPPDRTPWTAQSLYLFISAFVRVDRSEDDGATVAAWIRPKDEVIGLLLRGARNDQIRLAELSTILSDECHEVLETLQLMVSNPADSDHRKDASKSRESVQEEKRERGRFRILSPIGLIVSYGPALLKGTSNAVSGKLRRIREQRIIDRLKDVLLEGGLSTHECYETLSALGMDKSNIDAVLRKDVPTRVASR